ncbi:hypothetical protein CSA17_05330 [bacterium DOLJORAL78_65_58]|nr:MAG: hypothetical protein CSB20_02900 [bacterium DOLZORAL124_64_63]PIE75853.1 MAG: hypothetical protein CSA17_05330 [bacterium DOLJORAL78_65_58]
MYRTQANARSFKLFSATAIVLALMVMSVVGAAYAECQPGQIQEANLAYQSAARSLQNQQWDEAINRLNSIVGMCPEHVPANRGLGDAYMGKGDSAKAVTWYSKVITLRGDGVEAGDFAKLARAYATLKKYPEARAEYMKAQSLAPDDCGVLFNLGVMHYASGYHVQSVEALEHALEVCPDIREPVLKQLSKSATAAAQQQRKMGNNDKAAYYDNLMNKYGGAAGGSTAYDLAVQKFKAKKYAEAATMLEKLVQKDPKKAVAWLTLARSYDATGDKRGSIRAYGKYFELKPRDSKNMGTYIQVMVEGGQCSAAAAKAAQASKDLASLGRKNLAGIYYSWGLALECQEDYAGAKEKFQLSASSGNSRYAGPARTQVGRMDDFMKMTDAQRRKAAQKR